MAGLCLVFSVFCAVWVATLASASEIRGQISVVDGDTFDVGSHRVRLFGIDAPEATQSCTTRQGRNWTCGTWVSAEVARRYQNAHARCEVLGTDRYVRLIARCFVSDQDVAEVLVSEGLAFAYRKYAWDYDLAEKGAAVRNAGLHSSRMETPADYRRTRNRDGPSRKKQCVIKGNISANGTRIYHMPGQRHYDRTRIRADQEEKWFCTREAAQAAGFRAARR